MFSDFDFNHAATIDLGNPWFLVAVGTLAVCCLFIYLFRRVLNSQRRADGSYGEAEVASATVAAVVGVLFFPVTLLVFVALWGQQQRK